MKRRTKKILLLGSLVVAAGVVTYFQANAAFTRVIDPKQNCQTGFSTLVTCRLQLSSRTVWQRKPDPDWPGSKASTAETSPPEPDKLISTEVTLWALAECPENSVARRLLCATPSTAPRAEDAVVDPNTGLPLLQPWVLKTARSSPAISAVHVETPFDLAATLNFYRGALSKRGWTENSGALVTPDAAAITFTTTDGPALLRLSRRDNLTIVELSLRKPAAANSGLRPKPGQARLKLGNSRDEEAVITINDQTIKLAADAGHLMMDDTGTDNSDLNLPPGRYKVTLKTASGAAQTRELDLVVDETWGLVVGPDATPLPLRLY